MSTSVRVKSQRPFESKNEKEESSSARWLSGIVPPMIIPLASSNTLDISALERLVEHMIAGGVHGIFLLGSTGEGPSLSYALRRQLIKQTVHQVAGRIPILVGVTDTSFTESVELARYASDAGVRAVVASAPYYFQLSQDELLEYVGRIADSVPLPLVLYNIPQLTKTWFEVDTVRRAFEMENVIGIKDSSGDMDYFKRLQELAAHRPDVSLLCGSERMLMESMRSGGHGGVCGGANMFPALYVGLYQACLLGDTQCALTAHNAVIEIDRSVYSVATGDAAAIKAIKCALSILGLCQNVLAPALQPLDPPSSEILSRRLATLPMLHPESDPKRYRVNYGG